MTLVIKPLGKISSGGANAVVDPADTTHPGSLARRDVCSGNVCFGIDHEEVLPILRNCRRAMTAQAKLLILESVLPTGDTPHPGKLMDLLMLTVSGGVERTADAFSRLLAAADLAVARFIPVATGQTIIEVRVAGLPEPKEYER